MAKSALEELDYLLRTEFGLVFTPLPIHTDAVVVMDNRSGRGVSSRVVAHVLSLLPEVIEEAKKLDQAAYSLRCDYYRSDYDEE
jgi:hypothetical protein